ncbi:MAG: hypothetical protein ACE5JJ_11355 [Nitrospinota bacterium]
MGSENPLAHIEAGLKRHEELLKEFRSLGEGVAEVQGEIQSLSRGRGAVEKYASKRPPPPRFIITEH